MVSTILFLCVLTNRRLLSYSRKTRKSEQAQILRRKKDGDWYIYPQFLADENFKNVPKKAQKGCKIFKPPIHNVLSTGTNVVKIWLSLCLIRCVRFARYCGKMYSRHLFSYGGVQPRSQGPLSTLLSRR